MAFIGTFALFSAMPNRCRTATWNTPQRHTRTLQFGTVEMSHYGSCRLPPKIPDEPSEKRRAIELLGNYIQRKNLRDSAQHEMKALIGEIPETREIAQKWKGSLQRKRQRAPDDANAFRKRAILRKTIHLPEKNSTTSRCFILLGVLQRRYQGGQTPNAKIFAELDAALGSSPRCARDVHHYLGTLKQLQRERKELERRPPRMPTADVTEMRYACMLLGTWAVKGSVGKSRAKLELLLGACPRNRNVALSWKKIIASMLRKRQRKELVAQRRAVADAKRRFRKQKRDLQLLDSTGKCDFRAALHLPPLSSAECSPVAAAADADNHVSRQTLLSFVSRLRVVLTRFLCKK